MATGSAHCALAPYWRERLDGARSDFKAVQRSPRGGHFTLSLTGDRLHLFGEAVTVSRGGLLV